MIGENIRKFRTRNWMTQSDLADKLSVSVLAISRWENDEEEPSTEILEKMVELFGCNQSDLVNSVEENEHFFSDNTKVNNDEYLFVKEKEEVIEEKEAYINPSKEEEVTEETIKDSTVYEEEPIRIKEDNSFEDEKEESKYIEDYGNKEEFNSNDLDSRNELVICDRCKKQVKNSNYLTKSRNIKYIDGEVKLVIENLCPECVANSKIIASEKETSNFDKNRFSLAIIWPCAIFAFFMMIAIINFGNGTIGTGWFFFIISVFGCPFLGALILGNTFITTIFESAVLNYKTESASHPVDDRTFGSKRDSNSSYMSLVTFATLLLFALGIIVGFITGIIAYPIGLVNYRKNCK